MSEQPVVDLTGNPGETIIEAMIDLRKQAILRAIIREHILNAEPVGSKILVEHYDFGVSSATVRNEMSALEELGYLAQPHTSAGRVPTEQGYRYYVDSIMDVDPLTAPEEAEIKKRLESINHQVEGVLQNVSFMLSRLTNLMAVTIANSSPGRTVRRIDLIPLEDKRLLGLLVCSDGEVERFFLQLPRLPDLGAVKSVENYLTANLFGADSGGVRLLRSRLSVAAAQHLRDMDAAMLAGRVADEVAQILERHSDQQIFFDGANFILGQPEFSEASKAQSVFSALEERDRVLDLLHDVISTQKTVVKIGSELASLSAECSFVGASYRLSGGGIGALGILGPVRMNYDRAVSAVESVAAEISAIL